MELSDFFISQIDENSYLLDTKLIRGNALAYNVKVKFRLIEKVEDINNENVDGHVFLYVNNIDKNSVVESNFSELAKSNLCTIPSCFGVNSFGLNALVSLVRFKRKNSIVSINDKDLNTLKMFSRVKYSSIGDGMIYSPHFESYWCGLYFSSNEVYKDYVTSKNKNDKMILIDDISFVNRDTQSHTNINVLSSITSYIVSAFHTCKTSLSEHVNTFSEPRLYKMENVIRPSIIDALLLKFDNLSKENKQEELLKIKFKSEELESDYKTILNKNASTTHLIEHYSCFNNKQKDFSITDTGQLRLEKLKEISKTSKIYYENEIDWIPMSFFTKSVKDYYEHPVKNRELRFDNLYIGVSWL